MATLDSTIVNIALPVISHDLKIPMNQATWTVSLYLIVLSGLLIFFGRLGDLIGKVKVFRIGTVIFTAGSLLAGINLGIWFLLFARFIQAIGAAMTMSNSFGITTAIFPIELRARAMSTIGIFVSLGSITGPGMGGIILQFFHWSFIFWVNVPIGIIAMILGGLLLPKEEKVKLNKKQIDFAGTILFFLTISLFFLAVEIGQNLGFLHAIVMVCFAVSILMFVFFIVQERSAQSPMIKLGIFRNRLFTISLVACVLNFMTNFFSSIILPFYMEDFKGMTPGAAGVVMMFYPGMMMIFAPIGGYFADKYNKEAISLLGIGLSVAAQFGYIRFAGNTPLWMLIVFTGINGAGAAFFSSPNNALVMNSVDKHYLGVAGSLNSLARNIGTILGISIATTVLFTTMSLRYGSRVSNYLPERPDIFLTGMHVAFLVSCGIGIFTAVVVASRMFGVWKGKSKKMG
jgi:EmrB/QacA subfamily drug resistance transporter